MFCFLRTLCFLFRCISNDFWRNDYIMCPNCPGEIILMYNIYLAIYKKKKSIPYLIAILYFSWFSSLYMTCISFSPFNLLRLQSSLSIYTSCPAAFFYLPCQSSYPYFTFKTLARGISMDIRSRLHYMTT